MSFVYEKLLLFTTPKLTLKGLNIAGRVKDMCEDEQSALTYSELSRDREEPIY